jgi:ribonuclease M5
MKVGYIVEGFNDEQKLKSINPEIRCAVTQGTRFTNRTRMDIQALINECDVVYILTDPDEAGDQLAQSIQQEFPLARIYLDPDKAVCYRFNKKKIGVEHCDEEYLRSMLTHTMEAAKILMKGRKEA